jgi:hypothetical protein
VLPGLGLQRLLGLRPERSAVLPLGLLWCSLAYGLALVAGWAWLYPALSLAAGAPALRRASFADGPSLRGALPATGLVVALLALTQYPVNRVDRQGRFLLDAGEHQDTAVHVGVTFELVAGYPPQVPGLAGVPMSYHVGSHLVRAAAARWAGLHPYDMLSRFDPTLWTLALILALRAAADALGPGRGAVAIAGLLPLAADLSFIPGLVTGKGFWAYKLGGNTVEAVFYANSIAPALALALTALVALERHRRGEGRGWLVLAAALAAGVAQFKVFTGAQLLLALGLAWLLARETGARRAILLVSIPTALTLAMVVLGAGAGRAPAPVVRVEPLAPTNPALEAFGLPPAEGLVFGLAGLAWITLSLGLRGFGIPAAWRALRHGAPGTAAAGALALSGWPLASVLSIRADPRYDESFYFTQASGLLLALFALVPLLALARRSLATAIAAAAVTLVPAAEFVTTKALQAPVEIGAPAVRAMAALRAASCPGDVVVTRVRVAHVPLPVVLAGRRVALANYIGYWRQFTSEDALAARHAQVRAFLQSRTSEDARAAAGALHAGFVHLEGRERAPVEDSGALAPLFAEGAQRVYALAPRGGAPGGPR